jgi:exodeoxyribonuclease VIII
MNAILKPKEHLYGIAYGLPAEAYFAQPHLNNSGIKELLRSPAHYRHSLTAPREQTKAMQIGSAVHCAVLEPAEFGKRYAAMPDGIDRRTKEGKALYAELEANGKEILSANDFRDVMNIAGAVNTHPTAADLLSGGKPEVSVFGELDGVLVKCRFDWLRDDGIAVDLKTTQNASSSEFARTVGKYSYHRQASFYLDVASSVGVNIHTFRFIAVETSAPYGISVVELDDEAIELGRTQYLKALALYQNCVNFDDWPSYDTSIQTISMPKWAHYEFNNLED